MRDSGAGDELWTTMEGVDADSGFLWWLRSEFRRERERASGAGGGDFNRGETGQWGVVSPELGAGVLFEGLGTLEGSWDGAGCSWGMFAEDRARCMAAAEGTVVLEPARPGPLFGLTSVLLFFERSPGLACDPDGPVVRRGGRAGEVSREESGELAVDGEPDTFSDRPPLSACRMEAGPLSDAEAGGVALLAEGSLDDAAVGR